MIDLTHIKSIISQTCGEQAILGEELTGLQPTLIIHMDYLVAVCAALKKNPDTWFDFLSCISAVDLGNEGFGVVYHLSSIPKKEQLCLKVNVPANRDDQTTLPLVPSVNSVWKTAEWHEREAYDLMGIFFEGHPDLRRILLPDDWDGYPLRKDYKDAETYHGIAINPTR
ncbi:NADH-quinone oxidoreductase subunit C [Olivibacter sitiensis]|uniref:NADH-quinone oxidoreductase subunit C n=1 Tax=Olivibacter sitiensis TaxID=376470 RepID=UPI00040E09F2|nr:NADH-quinone oxidoreductase subunit C [Olivibacter sitiensis]